MVTIYLLREMICNALSWMTRENDLFSSGSHRFLFLLLIVLPQILAHVTIDLFFICFIIDLLFFTAYFFEFSILPFKYLSWPFFYFYTRFYTFKDRFLSMYRWNVRYFCADDTPRWGDTALFSEREADNPWKLSLRIVPLSYYLSEWRRSVPSENYLWVEWIKTWI